MSKRTSSIVRFTTIPYCGVVELDVASTIQYFESKRRQVIDRAEHHANTNPVIDEFINVLERSVFSKALLNARRDYMQSRSYRFPVSLREFDKNVEKFIISNVDNKLSRPKNPKLYAKFLTKVRKHVRRKVRWRENESE